MKYIREDYLLKLRKDAKFEVNIWYRGDGDED